MIGEWAGLNLAALDQLVELGWLEQVGPESGYQIHQIVRDSIARQMEKKGETVRLEEYGELLDRVIDTKSYLGKRVSYQKIRERLVLAEDLARFIENSGRVDVYKVALFNNIGGVLGNQGDNEKVLSYLEIEKDKLEHNQLDILSISKYIFNPFPVQRVYSRIFLGNYRTFVKIVENKLDQEYLDALSTYDNMTRVYHIQDIQEKEKIRRFPAINKHELGEEHQNTPSTYNNMAWLSDNQGSYKKALKYYQKALEAAEQLVNLEIPVRELIYINMALVYFAQDDYGNALKFFNLAYDKCLSKNIENDPHIQEMKTIIRFLEALRSN
jgi:tetratricopeptide (TPR) repeat protein